MAKHRAVLLAIWLIASSIGACTWVGSGSAPPHTVRIAAIHFAPEIGAVESNRARLVKLTEEAARNGAKIIVHTEMATSGYAFFSRADVAKVAEPIDGPTAAALGTVAKRYGAFVVVGLPITEPKTGRFFNSAILIGPEGTVSGFYNKRSMLLEASYNAIATGPIPVFETSYGRIAIVICADLFYPQIPRLAAIERADILIAPANVGIDMDFLKVRAYENDFDIVVANRYGKENQGAKPESFTQETFSIPSPFPYDFSWGSRTAIVTRDGQILAETSAAKDAIVYAEVPHRSGRTFPIVRRPELYSLMSSDTLEQYTFTQLGLPKPAEFAALSIDPGVGHHDPSAVADAIEQAILAAQAKGRKLRLAVLPMGIFDMYSTSVVNELGHVADRHQIDIVAAFRRESAAARTPMSVLLAAKPRGSHQVFRYYRTHRARSDDVEVSNNYFIVDRDYGRLAILHGEDLIAPETSIVMAKMGVDVLAVSADTAEPTMPALWRSRAGDYVHVVVANARGPEAIFAGGYQANPTEGVSEGSVIMLLNTAHVRSKKEPRHVDVTPLLESCSYRPC